MNKAYLVEFENGAEAYVYVDPSIFTEEWIADFNRYFYPYDTAEEFILDIAAKCIRDRSRIGYSSGGFIEGYGPIEAGSLHDYSLTIWDKDGEKMGVVGIDIQRTPDDQDWGGDVTEI